MGLIEKSDIVAIAGSFTARLYKAISEDPIQRYVAEERRLKVLLYVPEDAEDLILLTIEVQLTHGMSYKLQSGIWYVDSQWKFDIVAVTSKVIRWLSTLHKINERASSCKSAIRLTSNSLIRRAGISAFPLELISVETKPIDLQNAPMNRLTFVVHLLCLYETGNGEIKVDALFWDVKDDREWAEILAQDVLPMQIELRLKMPANLDSRPH